MLERSTTTLAILTLAFSVACGSNQQLTAQAEDPVLPGMMRQFQQSCPMLEEGVDVAVSDTEGGVALTFTTPGDVDLLRQRVRHMADMYAYHQERPMMWGHMGGMHGRGMGMMHGRHQMPAASAAFEQTEGGARILLTPAGSTTVDELRTAVRDHQSRMAMGQCWALDDQST